MNDAQRKQIKAELEKVLKLKRELSNIQTTLQDIQSDCQSAYDNMPEGLQSGEKGEEAQTSIDNLVEADCNFDTIECEFDSIEAYLLASVGEG